MKHRNTINLLFILLPIGWFVGRAYYEFNPRIYFPKQYYQVPLPESAELVDSENEGYWSWSTVKVLIYKMPSADAESYLRAVAAKAKSDNFYPVSNILESTGNPFTHPKVQSALLKYVTTPRKYDNIGLWRMVMDTDGGVCYFYDTGELVFYEVTTD